MWRTYDVRGDERSGTVIMRLLGAGKFLVHPPPKFGAQEQLNTITTSPRLSR
jgi:hypothetical protein